MTILIASEGFLKKTVYFSSHQKIIIFGFETSATLMIDRLTEIERSEKVNGP